MYGIEIITAYLPADISVICKLCMPVHDVRLSLIQCAMGYIHLLDEAHV